jgi:Glycosyltransferase 61
MRLQGMVGDSVTIRPAGSGWRPPDWITHPKRPSESSLQSSPPNEEEVALSQSQRPVAAHRLSTFGGAPEKSTRYRQAYAHGSDQNHAKVAARWHKEVCNPDDYDVEAGAPRGEHVADRTRTNFSKRRTVIQQHQNYLRRGARRHRLNFWQQVCALLLSLCVCLSLLGMIATLLSTKLDDLETKLESRAANMLYPEVNRIVHSSVMQNPSPMAMGKSAHGRRLLYGIDGDSAQTSNVVLNAEQSGASDKNALDRIPVSLSKSLASIAHAVSAFVRVASLVADEGDRPSKTASIMAGALNAAAASMVQRKPLATYYPLDMSSLGPVPSKEQINSVSSSLQIQLQKVLVDMLTKQVTEPVQIPQSLETAPAPLMQPQGRAPESVLPPASQSGFIIGAPGRNFNSPAAKTTSGLFPERPESAVSSSIPGDTRSGIMLSTSPIPSKFVEATAFQPVQTTGFMLTPPSPAQVGDAAPASAASSHGISAPEAIEIYALPSDKNVCRIYRSCRMQDNKVLLPQWMKRHSEELKTLCGLKNVLFVLDNVSPGSPLEAQFAIRHKSKEFPEGAHLSFEHRNRDVFGQTAPRDHMPHFVSDSFKPLTSIEAMLWSGKGRIPLAVIDPTTGGGEPKTNVPRFADISPALQLYEGTLNRAVTDWVPSVAEMFKNIGFEFSNAGNEKPDEKDATTIAMTGACFRSLITNNVKQYEPHGMFDVTGQNILFTANRLSRKDPALLPAMKTSPCTITVTALTRQGPRALLQLPELEQIIATMGQQLRIKTLFRAVDFNQNVPFADQVSIMQTSNVLVAAHGAGNANYLFMRPRSAVIEIFPFSYRAGPFNMFASILGLDYRYAMSEPQTDVFKECMNRHEKKEEIKKYAFSMWDQAVLMNQKEPGVHRLQFESEFGKAGQSEGMTTRQCVRMQELEFDIRHVASMAIEMARQQCQRAQSG